MWSGPQRAKEPEGSHRQCQRRADDVLDWPIGGETNNPLYPVSQYDDARQYLLNLVHRATLLCCCEVGPQ